MYGSASCTDVAHGWCLMSVIGAKWQTRAGHWASGLFGERCKQKPKDVLLPLWLDSWYLAFFSSKEARQAPWSPHRITTLRKWQYVFLAISSYLILLALAQLHFLFYVSSSWLWPMCYFAISLYQTYSSTSTSRLHAIPAIASFHEFMEKQYHLDGKYQTIVGMRLNCRTGSKHAIHHPAIRSVLSPMTCWYMNQAAQRLSAFRQKSGSTL